MGLSPIGNSGRFPKGKKQKKKEMFRTHTSIATRALWFAKSEFSLVIQSQEMGLCCTHYSALQKQKRKWGEEGDDDDDEEEEEEEEENLA